MSAPITERLHERLHSCRVCPRTPRRPVGTRTGTLTTTTAGIARR